MNGGRHYRAGWTREDYFWAKVDRSGECWIWTGYRNARGYGQFGHSPGRLTLAHRYSFELAKGPLGDKWALHTCDNPPCVNPDHLYAGDVRDNVRDMMQRGRHVALSGERSPMARLSTEQVADIRRRHVPGLNRWIRGNTAQLAEEFGVTPHYIQSLVRGEWRRVG